MIKIDLITGFLGAGKTTFLKKYASYLMSKGCKIGILENDFGAINIDMMLLQELLGEKCELEMIAGGCDKETHRRRFRTKLISMAMSGYDRVLIEPSGIYDVDEFFDTLYEEPLDRWYQAGSVIAVVDAGLEDELSEESEYLLASEAANAGCILLSKSQEVNEEQKARTIAHIEQSLQCVKCERNIRDIVLCKDWDKLTEEDFEHIASCSYVSSDYQKRQLDGESDFESLYFMNVSMTKEKLYACVKRMVQDASCGNVFRVKGFLKNKEGETKGLGWWELNATKKELTLKEAAVGQEVLIVIGENLNSAAIETYLKR
ncbi:MAG: GTP-binding protein [bacterium]|nr:GTP-binding protein [bacterium]